MQEQLPELDIRLSRRVELAQDSKDHEFARYSMIPAALALRGVREIRRLCRDKYLLLQYLHFRHPWRS